jgi:DNA mismatch endonuclease (patch repair protein)
MTFPSRKKVLFVHGCFWHAHQGCKVANRPKSRRPYWDAKFRRNVERDQANERHLEGAGWDVLTVWECELKGVAALARRIATFLGPAKATRSDKGARDGGK